jgi:site-specific DNA-adenine methylase
MYLPTGVLTPLIITTFFNVLSFLSSRVLYLARDHQHSSNHRSTSTGYIYLYYILYGKSFVNPLSVTKVEIINDINVDLVTLFRVVKQNLDEFVRWLLVARDEFERFRKEKPETLTDIQRAVRFYFLQRSVFQAES